MRLFAVRLDAVAACRVSLVVAASTIGGQRISERRIMNACLAYAIPMAVIFTITPQSRGRARPCRCSDALMPFHPGIGLVVRSDRFRLG
jgi:hypothetical protein